jgi:hypothetical protein
MRADWRIELINKLRDILGKWPDSIRLYLLILSCAVGAAFSLAELSLRLDVTPKPICRKGDRISCSIF